MLLFRLLKLPIVMAVSATLYTASIKAHDIAEPVNLVLWLLLSLLLIAKLLRWRA